jgi:hypothetical protein
MDIAQKRTSWWREWILWCSLEFIKLGFISAPRKKKRFGYQHCIKGRAIAQAVSRRLLTAAARVQTRV